MDMPPCNVTTGNTLRAVGLGRLTNQFNPRGQRKYQVLAAKDDEPFVPVVNTDDVLKASSCNKAGAVLLRRPNKGSGRATLSMRCAISATAGGWPEAISWSCTATGVSVGSPSISFKRSLASACAERRYPILRNYVNYTYKRRSLFRGPRRRQRYRGTP